ncbi:hypothetical protein LUZ62_020831 [Rhynchospora pubera]|uniref:Uncharacterized protein n=1 Tax=Rhynchospora pubera TaxID=906938 RepID=A0AAV8GRL1_9POAL|nr:hypothetical protein LUZ62_054484 [Rhynchospora pubera]KAJ4788742.1 hypothetical protein LUZ62_039988 [Rhynchospora pubera]KAJ4808265.1 hypothetical protein LUZ62_020831 [Rhynchospora pubera]
MSSNSKDLESNQTHDDETKPLLQATTSPTSPTSDAAAQVSAAQATMAKAFKSTADLAKHLPTGTVLIFQILSPVFTNQGSCDQVNRIMAGWLVALCGLAIVFLNFTDSFKDSSGHVRYVVATFKGLWVIDGSPPPEPEIAKTYRLKFIDFLHAFMALMVFAAVALFDNNIESCFYPVLSYDTRQILTAVPVATGLIGSALFVVFPSSRHGIGFPSTS